MNAPLFQDANSPFLACPVDEIVALSSLDFGHAGHWNDHRLSEQYLGISLPRALLACCSQSRGKLERLRQRQSGSFLETSRFAKRALVRARQNGACLRAGHSACKNAARRLKNQLGVSTPLY